MHRTVTRAGEVVALIRAQQLPFLAAALAYYALLSVVPLLVVALVLATTLAGDALATDLLATLDEFLTPETADLLESTLVNSSGRGGVTVAGGVVLLWGALRVFRGLDIAFSAVYGVPLDKALLEQVGDALLVLVAVVLAVAVTVLGSLLLSLASVGVGGTLGLLAVLPPVFYFAGLVLLVGAALNAVLAGRLEDRQLQQGRRRRSNQRANMGEDDRSDEHRDGVDETTSRYPGVQSLQLSRGDIPRGDTTRDVPDDVVTEAELEELRERIEGFESDIEDRTVHREELEGDLKRYVRGRIRRGHARDWGPYLILLYGTVMTVGAFVFLGGGWAVLAMIIVWLSTLGLYALMVIVGLTAGALALPGRVADGLRGLR